MVKQNKDWRYAYEEKIMVMKSWTVLRESKSLTQYQIIMDLGLL